MYFQHPGQMGLGHVPVWQKSSRSSEISFWTSQAQPDGVCRLSPTDSCALEVLRLYDVWSDADG